MRIVVPQSHDARSAFAFEELEPKVVRLAKTGMVCPMHHAKVIAIRKVCFRNQPAKILLSNLRNGWPIRRFQYPGSLLRCMTEIVVPERLGSSRYWRPVQLLVRELGGIVDKLASCC